MKNNLAKFNSFLNDSKKQFEDAAKKDKEFCDDVDRRLSELEFKYARLSELVDVILFGLYKSKGE